MPPPHGGNLEAAAARLGCRPRQILDASASLVPFGPGLELRLPLLQAAWGLPLRSYPDRSYRRLRAALASGHGLDPAWVLPGNGAAELFTWAARDAAAAGISLLPQPGFADYQRALACWGGAWRPLPLPLHWPETFPQPFPLALPGATTAGVTSGGATAAGDAAAGHTARSGGGNDRSGPEAAVLWITNPHNPTGQLWSRASLEPLLERYALVIVDEAFLPLTLAGEAESLVPLLERHPNLVVIRSLTKLHAIAGLRLGYALAHPERLARWATWRDPWPVNGLAAAVGEALCGDRPAQRRRRQRWQQRVQHWLAREGPWLQHQLARIPGLMPLPSATNYLLVRGLRPEASVECSVERAAAGSRLPRAAACSDAAFSDAACSDAAPLGLVELRQQLEQRHRILLRDCRSFPGLDGSWLRIGLQDRRGNRRIVQALTSELSSAARR